MIHAIGVVDFVWESIPFTNVDNSTLITVKLAGYGGYISVDCVNLPCISKVDGHNQLTNAKFPRYTEPRKSLGTWLREISSCYCLTFLPGPASLLLNKICTSFIRFLYYAVSFVPGHVQSQSLLTLSPSSVNSEKELCIATRRSLRCCDVPIETTRSAVSILEGTITEDRMIMNASETL